GLVDEVVAVVAGAAGNADLHEKAVNAVVHGEVEDDGHQEDAPANPPHPVANEVERTGEEGRGDRHNRGGRGAGEDDDEEAEGAPGGGPAVPPLVAGPEGNGQGHEGGPEASGQKGVSEGALAAQAAFADPGDLGDAAEDGKEVALGLIFKDERGGDGGDDEGCASHEGVDVFLVADEDAEEEVHAQGFIQEAEPVDDGIGGHPQDAVHERADERPDDDDGVDAAPLEEADLALEEDAHPAEDQYDAQHVEVETGDDEALGGGD